MLLPRFAFFTLAAAAPLGALALIGGCSSDTKKNAAPPLVVTDDDVSVSKPPPPDPPDVALPTTPDTGPPTGTIFVQTGLALKTYDPYSKALKDVGAFGCMPATDFMMDIAVDRDGNVYGTTYEDRFVRVDPNTGACSLIRQGTGLEYPVLIAFVPKGTLDPANDALVGFDDDSYLRVDVRTGAVTKVGTLNPPDAGSPYSAAGDLIYAGQNGMFLTATVGSGPQDAGDSFVRFDPKTGRRLALVGTTGYKRLYGLGYWGGSIFAFTTPGEILQIDPASAKATLLKRVDGGPPKDGGPDPVFYGAGSTTVAPESPRP